jgi:hypothetical protein
MTHPVVEVARRYVGAREVPKGSNRGPLIDDFTGGRAEPYCAHAVAFWHRVAGKPIPGDVIPTPLRANPLASVSFTLRVFSEHDWLVREPAVGDVVFFRERGQSDPGRGRHIGIVVDVSDPKRLTIIDANWNDAVCERKIDRQSESILAFGRRP